MIGLKMTVTAVFKTLLMLMLVLASSQSIGLCISAVTPSLAMAQAISPIVMMLVVMFGGFYLQVSRFLSVVVELRLIELFLFADQLDSYLFKTDRGIQLLAIRYASHSAIATHQSSMYGGNAHLDCPTQDLLGLYASSLKASCSVANGKRTACPQVKQ